MELHLMAHRIVRKDAEVGFRGQEGIKGSQTAERAAKINPQEVDLTSFPVVR